MSVMPRTLLALVALAGVVAACDKVEQYQTRGLVGAVSGTGPDLSIAVHHERIAAFRDRDGKTMPMDSMVMIFGIDEALATAPPKQGDKLSFAFTVRWDERPALRITRFSRLAPDTLLSLSHAH